MPTHRKTVSRNSGKAESNQSAKTNKATLLSHAGRADVVLKSPRDDSPFTVEIERMAVDFHAARKPFLNAITRLCLVGYGGKQIKSDNPDLLTDERADRFKNELIEFGRLVRSAGLNYEIMSMQPASQGMGTVVLELARLAVVNDAVGVGRLIARVQFDSGVTTVLVKPFVALAGALIDLWRERETSVWLARIDRWVDSSGINIRAHVKRQSQWTDDARGFIDALGLDEGENTFAPIPTMSARRTNRR
jgi:hypothetical protein